MKRRKLYSFLSIFLMGLLLGSCLPIGVFSAEETKSSGEKYRGSTMSEDDNGVFIYDALEQYVVKSMEDVELACNYKTQSASAPTVTEAKVDSRYPSIVVDLAVYCDTSIVGTTPVIRYGLSEIDAVTYIDSATGKAVAGKAPRELTASNGGDPTYNGGYGVNEKGETTTHYDNKNVLFYIINHNCHERIGTEDDVSILSDYISQGYLVVVLDYGNQAEATSPYIELSLVSAYELFQNKSAMMSDLTYENGKTITLSNEYFYLPEGYRVERDVWYYDPSLWAINGLMETFMNRWNSDVANTANDTLGLGTFSSVEDMINRFKARSGKPIDYKLSMNILYPSQPKDGYKSPLYIQEGTTQIRELAVQISYTRCTYMGFALNGYAAVQYDYPFYPFLSRFQYPAVTGYGTHDDNNNNARAAVRCARYYADALGYSDELVGHAGISKATVGASTIAVVGNKDIQSRIAGYNNQVSAGDVFESGVLGTEKTPDNRLMEIVQPFMTYEDGETEVSSDVLCSYCSAGGGVGRFFGRGEYTGREIVPMVVSDGLRDEYNCYDYYEQLEQHYIDLNKSPYLLIPMLDQAHTYPVGYDDEYGYDRHMAMISFFDIYLKPDEARAPEVIWITPTNGSTDIPVSGKWTVGPYTPFGWEMNSYERAQHIQVRFVDAVSPDSVNEGMIVTDRAGNRVEGEWVASQHDAMYTFVCDGLKAGTTYTITATSGILSKNGVPLDKETSVTFTTEGSHAQYAVADTYVSATKPDEVFGKANELLVDGDHIALLSYSSEYISTALKLSLSSFVTPDTGADLSVYAMPNYLVDENSLTYRKLMGSEAWDNKISLGTFTSLESRELSVDVSALSDAALGEYVTIVLLSNSNAMGLPYVYENNFESYGADSPVSGWEPNGGISSVFVGNAEGNHDPISVVTEDGTKALRTTGDAGTLRLYSTIKKDALTDSDVGKVYRVSMKVKTSKDVSLTFGLINASSSTIRSEKCIANVKAGQWQEVSFVVSITKEVVDNAAGLLGVSLPMYFARTHTWFDDIVVTESTPRVTFASRESGQAEQLTLITLNEHTVTYLADGNAVATQTVLYGKDAEAPEVPKKEGYLGTWDHDGTQITEDIEIHAVYTEIVPDEPESLPESSVESTPVVEPENPSESQKGDEGGKPTEAKKPFWLLIPAAVLAVGAGLVAVFKKKKGNKNG